MDTLEFQVFNEEYIETKGRECGEGKYVKYFLIGEKGNVHVYARWKWYVTTISAFENNHVVQVCKNNGLIYIDGCSKASSKIFVRNGLPRLMLEGFQKELDQIYISSVNQ